MGSRKVVRKSSPTENCANQVMETVPLVVRFIRSEMRARKSTELSVPQFRALAFLDRNPGASLSELAQHLGVTSATASANTERLVQRNFIARCDHPQERRRIELKLTPEGQHHLQSARSSTRATIAQLLGSLTEEQIAQVEQGLGLLKQVFEGQDPPELGS